VLSKLSYVKGEFAAEYPHQGKRAGEFAQVFHLHSQDHRHLHDTCIVKFRYICLGNLCYYCG